MKNFLWHTNSYENLRISSRVIGVNLIRKLKLMAEVEIQNYRTERQRARRSQIQNGAVAGAVVAWMGGAIGLIVMGDGAESTFFRRKACEGAASEQFCLLCQWQSRQSRQSRQRIRQQASRKLPEYKEFAILTVEPNLCGTARSLHIVSPMDWWRR